MDDLRLVAEFFGENRAALVLFLLALFVLFAFGFIALFFVVRPMRRLFERAKTVSQTLSAQPGDKSQPAPKDEIRFISETFQVLETDIKKKDQLLQELYEKERSRAESLEQYTQHLLENLTSGLLFFDRNRVLKLLNPTATAILGVPADMKGRAAEEIFSGPWGQTWLGWLDAALQKSGVVHEVEWTQPGGRWLRISSSLTLDPSGQVLGCTFLFNDVTSFKEMAEQVNRQKSLAAMGEMVAGLAHEIRNPLGALKGFAGLLERKIPARDAKKKLARDVLKEANQLNVLVSEFLEFARPEPREMVEVDVQHLVDNVLQALSESRKKARVRTKKELLPGPWPVWGDPIRLRQALYNLMLNAIESMPGGGELYVSSELSSHDAGPRSIVLVVRDSGKGIGPEDLSKIFIPFYSTKAQGTGLGLSIVHRIISEHGGNIEVESQAGKGTSFKVRLPLHVSVPRVEEN